MIIYCFKCDKGYSFAQKYNVNTNTWEEIQEFPIQDLYSDSYSSISIDKYIYIYFVLILMMKTVYKQLVIYIIQKQIHMNL